MALLCHRPIALLLLAALVLQDVAAAKQDSDLWAKTVPNLVADRENGGACGTVLHLYSHDPSVVDIATEDKPTKDAGKNIRLVLLQKKRAVLDFFNNNVDLVNDFADFVNEQWAAEHLAHSTKEVVGHLGRSANGSLVQGAAADVKDGRKYVVHVKGFAGGKDKIVDVPHPKKVAKLVARAIAIEEGKAPESEEEDWAFQKIAILGYDGDNLETGSWSQVLPYLGQKLRMSEKNGDQSNKRLRRSRQTEKSEFFKGGNSVLGRMLKSSAEAAQDLQNQINQWKNAAKKDQEFDSWTHDTDLDLILADIVTLKLFSPKGEEDPLRAKLYFHPTTKNLRFEDISSHNKESKEDKINHLKSEEGIRYFSWDGESSTEPLEGAAAAKDPFANRPDLSIPTEFYYQPGRMVATVKDNKKDIVLSFDQGGDEPLPALANELGFTDAAFPDMFSKTRWFGDENASTKFSTKSTNWQLSKTQHTVLKFGTQILRNSLAEFKPENGYTHVVVTLGGGPTVQDEFKDLIAEPYFKGVRIYSVDVVRMELQMAPESESQWSAAKEVVQWSAAKDVNVVQWSAGTNKVVQKLVSKRLLFSWVTAPSSTDDFTNTHTEFFAQKFPDSSPQQHSEVTDLVSPPCGLLYGVFQPSVLEGQISKDAKKGAKLEKMWYKTVEEAGGVAVRVFRLSTEDTGVDVLAGARPTATSSAGFDVLGTKDGNNCCCLAVLLAATLCLVAISVALFLWCCRKDHRDEAEPEEPTTETDSERSV